VEDAPRPPDSPETPDAPENAERDAAAIPEADEQAPPRRWDPVDGPIPRSRNQMRAAWIGGVVLWVAGTLLFFRDSVGLYFGLLVGLFVAAVVARFLYLKILRRNNLWKLWAPWVFVLAGCAAISIGSTKDIDWEESDAEVTQNCIDGGMAEYESGPNAATLQEFYNPAEVRILLERFCSEAVDRGLVADPTLTAAEQRELDVLMTDTINDLVAEGKIDLED
jgi:hypothetical protein